VSDRDNNSFQIIDGQKVQNSKRFKDFVKKEDEPSICHTP
jgi:hypothetical protein